MPRFAANLSMMFNEVDFLDRFASARAAGFTAVEYLFPYDFSADEIARRLRDNGLTQALFNLPPGDWAAGQRGLACMPQAYDEVMRGVERALPYIEATGVRRVHLMAGLGVRSDTAQLAAYKRALAAVAARLAREQVDLLIEPINTRDMPGYFLDNFDVAMAIIEDLALPNLKLQFDIYHRQILHGDVTIALREMFPRIGHIQIASVPARNEPMAGELNDVFLFAELDRLGYDGFVGCEYRPAGKTEAGLGWFAPWRV